MPRSIRAKGAAWSVPETLAPAAPPATAARAVSTPPGLRGCVALSERHTGRRASLVLDGSGAYPQRGLWVFNTDGRTSITDASITFYFTDTVTLRWVASAGNSGWTVPAVDRQVEPVAGHIGYTTRYLGTWQFVAGSPDFSYAVGQPRFESPLAASAVGAELSGYARRSVGLDGSMVTFSRGPVLLHAAA